MAEREFIAKRGTVPISLEQTFWSPDYAELTIWQSEGTAEITKSEALAIAKMLTDWATQQSTEVSQTAPEDSQSRE